MQIPAPIDADPRLVPLAIRLTTYLGGRNAISQGADYTWHLLERLLRDADGRVWMETLAAVLRQTVAFGNPVTVEQGDSPGAADWIMVEISTDCFVGVWWYEEEDDTIIVQALDKNWGGLVNEHILLRTRSHTFPDIAHCIMNWLGEEWNTITSYKTDPQDVAV